MLKALFVSACMMGLVCSARADVSILGDFGLLKTAGGATNVPIGGLLMLVASPSGSATNLSAPTATSFVSGDNIIVAKFTMNYNGGAGETTNNPSFTLQNTGASASTTFDAGDPLLLRWYPTLTASSSAPGVGTMYGEFRTTATTDGGSPWVTPADGTINYALYLITLSAGGNQPNSAGYAGFTVVPEPGSVALVLAASLGLGALGRRKFKG